MNFQSIKHFIIKGTDNTWHQLLRNSIVGIFTLGCDLMLLYLLVDYLAIQKVVASVIASIFGGVVNFAISSKWVFNQRRFSNLPLEFLIFTIIGIVGLGLNALLFWVMTDVFGCYYIASKIISCLLVFIVNFFMRKYLIFFKSDKVKSQREKA